MSIVISYSAVDFSHDGNSGYLLPLTLQSVNHIGKFLTHCSR